jgi:hypothetical protein
MKNINTIQKIVILILVFLGVLFFTTDFYDRYDVKYLTNYMFPLMATSAAAFFLFKSKE